MHYVHNLTIHYEVDIIVSIFKMIQLWYMEMMQLV